MQPVKDTLRALVQISFDGRVYKTFRGPKAAERFANEVKVLQYLEEKGCSFVPQLLSADPKQLQMVTSHCGERVEHVDDARVQEIFAELESYGVHHDDAEARNLTYSSSKGRFNLIDFEFATILANHEPTHNHNQNAALRSGLRWSGSTNRGQVRQINEDSFLGIKFDSREVHYLGDHGEAQVRKSDYVFAVSDGAGGAMAGQYASWVTMEKIIRLLPRSFRQSTSGLEAGGTDVLDELFTRIHRALALVRNSYDECLDMQSTLSLCWFAPGWMYFAHIGDGRIYYLPKAVQTIRQLSHDHTPVGELVRSGQIEPSEAKRHPQRSVLLKSLGGEESLVEPQLGAVAYEVGDRFLLCTNGLVERLSDQQIFELLPPSAKMEKDFHPARNLVAAAVAAAGRDNTTAVVIELV